VGVFLIFLTPLVLKGRAQEIFIRFSVHVRFFLTDIKNARVEKLALYITYNLLMSRISSDARS
jgi:hypothetical protein